MSSRRAAKRARAASGDGTRPPSLPKRARAAAPEPAAAAAELTRAQLNRLAPRLLDLAAARDLELAHHETFEHAEEQLLLHLRYYALGLQRALPAEWRPALDQLERERADPDLDVYLLLHARYTDGAPAPLLASARGYRVPRPHVGRLHRELSADDFPWVDHALLRARRAHSRAERVSTFLQGLPAAPAAGPAPRPASTVTTLNDLRRREARDASGADEDDDDDEPVVVLTQ